jgi:KUP system potassium uptake protein
MEPPEQRQSRRYLLTLSLGALGVVYGDIGTSPLYAFKECFAEHHGRQLLATPENILGVLSLIFWSLTFIISFAYLNFVMRADNRGEGGILALMSMVKPRSGSVRRTVLIGLGLFGAALLYGDGMITPAISVLGAIEGLEVATPIFSPYILYITIAILAVLFIVQRYGTGRVGKVFGPIMILWFLTLAAMGLWHIVREPSVFIAINPMYAVRFFMDNGLHGFLVLGAVFLVVTGGEALYADMGHFGARPIRLAWYWFVFPSLLLNYFGQGAFLLRTPEGIVNPFFTMAPKWGLYPLVILATLAASIASQAVITGAFSITRQAVQLGYLPRLRIHHTSAREIGQIYIPSVNWGLMVAAMGLVITFRSVSNLSAAYGVAVTATMAITTSLLAVVARERWRWTIPAVAALTVPMLLADLSFFGANIVKLFDGGWFPLVVGLAVFGVTSTWFAGRRILNARLAETAMTMEMFLGELEAKRIHRVRGTAIFMTRAHDGIPTTLLHNIKHNKVVHETVVFLSVDIEEIAYLSDDERHEWVELGNGVYRLFLRFGFMEDPDIPRTLGRLPGPIKFNPMTISYFLGRETLIPTKRPGMVLWREHLFSWMMRNSSSASSYFSLPANQVIELGAQVEI